MTDRRWFPNGWFDLCKAPRGGEVVLIAVKGRNNRFVTPARWVSSDDPLCQRKRYRTVVERYDGYWASPRDSGKMIGAPVLAWRPMPTFAFEAFEMNNPPISVAPDRPDFQFNEPRISL